MPLKTRSTRVSDHFVWGEFAMHDGTLPPPKLFAAARDLALRYLEPLRLAYGPTTIVSGYRSADHNRAVGGAPASRHVPANEPGVAAADIVCRHGTPRQWYQLLAELSPGGLGLYTGHVHVDNRRGVARW